MKKKLFIIIGALVVIGAEAGGALYYAYPVQMSTIGGLTRNYVLSLGAPAGTTTTETNPDYKRAGAAGVPPAATTSTSTAPGRLAKLQPNRQLGTFLAARPDQRDECQKAESAVHLRRRRIDGFESGPIMVNDAVIGTTEFDIFSLDPATCAQNWRIHEELPASLLSANRGAAYGTAGCSGAPRTARCWPMTSRPASESGQRTSPRGSFGESVPAAPIALQRPRIHRQRRWRLQGRQGKDVRTRRQTGKVALGVLHGA